MTAFSDAVSLPWPREAPVTPFTSRPDAFAQIAAAGPDTAVAIWGERVNRTGGPNNYYYTSALIHLGGVRYTEAGPQVTETLLTLASDPSDRSTLLFDAVTTVDGQAWALFSYENGEAPSTAEFRMARLSVDDASLEVSITWVWSLPRLGGYSSEPTLLDVWPEQRRAIIATQSGSTTDGKLRQAVYLVDLDSGALLSYVAIPNRSTTPTYPQGLSFNKHTGEVAFLGERVVSGRGRSALWTAPVTPASIGAWTYRNFLPVRDPLQGYSPEKVAIVVLPDGRWEWIGSQYPDYSLLDHGFFTFPTTVTMDLAVSSNFVGWLSTAGQSVSVARDESLGRTVAVFSTITDRTVEEPGTTGGVYHLELDGSTIAETQLLPRTDFAVVADNARIASLGEGRFLYLLGAAGVRKPYSTDYASYEFNVWAGGPVQSGPVIPGIKGEAPSENKGRFRRVN